MKYRVSRSRSTRPEGRSSGCRAESTSPNARTVPRALRPFLVTVPPTMARRNPRRRRQSSSRRQSLARGACRQPADVGDRVPAVCATRPSDSAGGVPRTASGHRLLPDAGRQRAAVDLRVVPAADADALHVDRHWLAHLHRRGQVRGVTDEPRAPQAVRGAGLACGRPAVPAYQARESRPSAPGRRRAAAPLESPRPAAARRRRRRRTEPGTGGRGTV